MMRRLVVALAVLSPAIVTVASPVPVARVACAQSVAGCTCDDRPPFVLFDAPPPPKTAIASLARTLRDSGEAARFDAARQLGRIRDSATVEPLVHALHDPSCPVASAAAWSLRGVADDRAAAPLRDALLHGGCLVRARAAEVFALHKGPESVRVALVAIHDADPRVRAPVARGLGELGDRRAVAPLIGAMRDPDKHVRQAAAEALGRLRDARALPALTAALRDESKEVRQAAADAIGRLGKSS